MMDLRRSASVNGLARSGPGERQERTFVVSLLYRTRSGVSRDVGSTARATNGMAAPATESVLINWRRL